jgi:hypothetical protein
MGQSYPVQNPLGHLNQENNFKYASRIKASRAPTSNDKKPVGRIWIDTANNNVYHLTSYASGSPTWTETSLEAASDAEAQAKTEGSGTYLTASNLAAEGFLQWTDVTLTSTEVKALETTPIELVPAQGAGSVIKFMGALLKLDYGGTNGFTEGGNDNVVINYTDGSGVSVSQSVEGTGFIDQTADTYTNAEPAIDAIVAATGAENQALVLHNPGTGIGGNAADDNTLVVRTYYIVQSI